MPSTATQPYSHDQNEERRRARLQAARSVDAGKAANDDYLDPKGQLLPEKGSVKQPSTINSPLAEQSRAQDLKIQQRTANDSLSQKSAQDLPSPEGKQDIKQKQSMAQNMRRQLKNKFSLKRRREIQKHLKTIQKYENTSFMLAYSAAIAADILDVINAALAVIPIVQFLTIPLFTLMGFILRLYLSIFIWTRSNRLSRKITRVAIVLLLDSVPLVNLLPATTLVIFLLDKKMEKKAEEAKEALKRLT